MTTTTDILNLLVKTNDDQVTQFASTLSKLTTGIGTVLGELAKVSGALSKGTFDDTGAKKLIATLGLVRSQFTQLDVTTKLSAKIQQANLASVASSLTGGGGGASQVGPVEAQTEAVKKLTEAETKAAAAHAKYTGQVEKGKAISTSQTQIFDRYLSSLTSVIGLSKEARAATDNLLASRKALNAQLQTLSLDPKKKTAAGAVDAAKEIKAGLEADRKRAESAGVIARFERDNNELVLNRAKLEREIAAILGIQGLTYKQVQTLMQERIRASQEIERSLQRQVQMEATLRSVQGSDNRTIILKAVNQELASMKLSAEQAKEVINRLNGIFKDTVGTQSEVAAATKKVTAAVIAESEAIAQQTKIIEAQQLAKRTPIARIAAVETARQVAADPRIVESTQIEAIQKRINALVESEFDILRKGGQEGAAAMQRIHAGAKAITDEVAKTAEIQGTLAQSTNARLLSQDLARKQVAIDYAKVLAQGTVHLTAEERASLNLRAVIEKISERYSYINVERAEGLKFARAELDLELRKAGILKELGRNEGTGVSKLGELAVLGIIANRINSSLRDLVTRFGEFEEKMVVVRKTANATVEQMHALMQSVLSIGQGVPIAVNDLADIAGALGQVGAINFNNVKDGNAALLEAAEAIKLVGQVTLTSDLNAQQAAEAYGQLAAIFQDDITRIKGTLTTLRGVSATTADAMRSVFGAMNEISNQTVATTGHIREFIQNFGGVASASGLAIETVIGLAGAIKDLGVSPQVAGTALSGLFAKAQSKAEVFAKVMKITTTEWVELFSRDAESAMLSFLKQFDKLGEASKSLQLEIANELGVEQRQRNTLFKLAAGHELVADRIKKASNGLANYNSVQTEAEKAATTFNSGVTKLSNGLTAVATALSPILGVIGKILGELGALLTMFADTGWGQAAIIFGSIAAAITGLTLTVTVASASLTLLSGTSLGAALSASTLGVAFSGVTASITTATAAMTRFGVATAAVGGTRLSLGPVLNSAPWVSLWKSIKDVSSAIKTGFIPALMSIPGALVAVKTGVVTAFAAIPGALVTAKAAVVAFGTTLATLPALFAGAIVSVGKFAASLLTLKGLGAGLAAIKAGLIALSAGPIVGGIAAAGGALLALGAVAIASAVVWTSKLGGETEALTDVIAKYASGNEASIGWQDRMTISLTRWVEKLVDGTDTIGELIEKTRAQQKASAALNAEISSGVAGFGETRARELTVGIDAKKAEEVKKAIQDIVDAEAAGIISAATAVHILQKNVEGVVQAGKQFGPQVADLREFNAALDERVASGKLTEDEANKARAKAKGSYNDLLATAKEMNITVSKGAQAEDFILRLTEQRRIALQNARKEADGLRSEADAAKAAVDFLDKDRVDKEKELLDLLNQDVTALRGKESVLGFILKLEAAISLARQNSADTVVADEKRLEVLKAEKALAEKETSVKGNPEAQEAALLRLVAIKESIAAIEEKIASKKREQVVLLNEQSKKVSLLLDQERERLEAEFATAKALTEDLEEHNAKVEENTIKQLAEIRLAAARAEFERTGSLASLRQAQQLEYEKELIELTEKRFSTQEARHVAFAKFQQAQRDKSLVDEMKMAEKETEIALKDLEERFAAKRKGEEKELKRLQLLEKSLRQSQERLNAVATAFDRLRDKSHPVTAIKDAFNKVSDSVFEAVLTLDLADAELIKLGEAPLDGLLVKLNLMAAAFDSIRLAGKAAGEQIQGLINKQTDAERALLDQRKDKSFNSFASQFEAAQAKLQKLFDSGKLNGHQFGTRLDQARQTFRDQTAGYNQKRGTNLDANSAIDTIENRTKLKDIEKDKLRGVQAEIAATDLLIAQRNEHVKKIKEEADTLAAEAKTDPEMEAARKAQEAAAAEAVATAKLNEAESKRNKEAKDLQAKDLRKAGFKPSDVAPDKGRDAVDAVQDAVSRGRSAGDDLSRSVSGKEAELAKLAAELEAERETLRAALERSRATIAGQAAVTTEFQAILDDPRFLAFEKATNALLARDLESFTERFLESAKSVASATDSFASFSQASAETTGEMATVMASAVAQIAEMRKLLDAARSTLNLDPLPPPKKTPNGEGG